MNFYDPKNNTFERVTENWILNIAMQMMRNLLNQSRSQFWKRSVFRIGLDSIKTFFSFGKKGLFLIFFFGFGSSITRPGDLAALCIFCNSLTEESSTFDTPQGFGSLNEALRSLEGIPSRLSL